MSELPADYLYTKDHEWIQLHDDGTATIGITDYAQESLGDITFVEFPELVRRLRSERPSVWSSRSKRHLTYICLSAVK